MPYNFVSNVGTCVGKCDFKKISERNNLTILLYYPQVFIDMFAVALVVPLLFQYFKRSGVTSAGQREILSSVFSSSQIVGGLGLGALTDARILRRKTVLFMSFGGSAVAYALMVTGGFGFSAMVASRVIVGLVKQTMTITTSMLAKCTTERNRAKYMGRLESSATAAWIAGPSVGAMLYKYVDYKAPALVACFLFAVNTALAAVFLREIEQDYSPNTIEAKGKRKGKFSSFTENTSFLPFSPEPQVIAIWGVFMKTIMELSLIIAAIFNRIKKF